MLVLRISSMNVTSGAAAPLPHAHVGASQNCERMQGRQKQCQCGCGFGPLTSRVASQQRDAVGGNRPAPTPAPAVFRYQRYADLKGWKVQRVNENIMEGGGYKECVLQVLQSQFTTVVK